MVEIDIETDMVMVVNRSRRAECYHICFWIFIFLLWHAQSTRQCRMQRFDAEGALVVGQGKSSKLGIR